MRLTFDIDGSPELHLRMLKILCGDIEGKSMIDMGACEAAITPKIGFTKRTYVDIQNRKLQDENEQQYLVQYNILDFLNDKGGYYDVLLCLDCIEHLTKLNGYEFLVKTTLHSDKQIFFTPLGDYVIETTATNNPDAHRSGWLPEDFEQVGWATIVFPNYHKTLGIGAFYAFHTDVTEQEFERIKNELYLIYE